jgi:hypothetical protein
MTGTVLDELGNPYQGIRNSATKTLNIATGLYSATFTIAITNVRQVFLSLTQIKYSVANAYSFLQIGQGTVFITGSGYYNGVLTEQQNVNTVWTNTGIILTPTYASTTAEHYLTVKLTRLGPIGGRTAWAVNLQGGCSNFANAYYSGSGFIQMQSSGLTTLSSLRILSQGSTMTGYGNLYVA